MYMQTRQTILNDIRLAKHQIQKPSKPASTRRPPKVRPKKPATTAATSGTKKQLSKLLSPKNLQQSVKTVTNLRTTVKSWLQYLNQADQVLDTLFVTTNSLKETGILDKLVKQKGKNLTTDDFTSILIALMNSPMGGQLFKSVGGSDDEETTTEETK